MRETQWFGMWQVVDKPKPNGERERLRYEGIVQARQWEDLDPHKVMKQLSKLPQKASGPDGVSYALLKALPIEGVTALCNMYRKWELEGRLPDQVRTTLVLLLPKKEDIERPISLTSVLYRTWCRLRWDKLRPWQTSIGQKLSWERSVPGTHVLQVALMRLLKCEVGRATGKHVVSLLVDLQCFYDSVVLEQLLEAWEPLDFPPAVMNMVYEVYTGPRLLQAEQVTSKPVICSKGILAGCPAAPLVAKLILAPVLGPFKEQFHKATIDVWVDDISIDFVGDSVRGVCQEALHGFDVLQQRLTDAGLTMSLAKTGYLASSNDCKKEITLLRREDQPTVHELLKDLGLDSSGGRRRRIGTQQKRLLKAGRRNAKLSHLKIKARPIRIRVWKTSVHSAACYGLEAQGIAPQRLQTLRTQLARHGGLQKGGSVDVVYDQNEKLQDPLATVVERQLKAMHLLVLKWPPEQLAELHTAWRISWRRLKAAAYPWMVVTGPMAALQVYMMDMGWDASCLNDWVRAQTGLLPTAQLNLEFPWPYLQRQLQQELANQRARRIQELEHAFPLMRRPDWSIYRKAMKQASPSQKVAINAWTQGLLRAHYGGERMMCPMCQVPVSMKHLVWQCNYHKDELPQEWKQMIAANENTMLWARGLIDQPAFDPCEGADSCEVDGIFSHGWPVRIGPHQRLAIGAQQTSKDPRVRRYAVAVVAMQWQVDAWQVIGQCTAIAPGHSTEARAWFFGCWLVLQMVLGRHQLNIPHPAGWTAIQKGAAGRVAPDLWHNLPEDEWKRLQLLQVPWKLMKSQATHDRGRQQYLLAKQLAVQRAHREQPKSLEQELVIEDQLHLEVYMTAAKRISKMLQDKEHYMNGKLEPVPDSGPKETKKKPPQGRLALLRQLTLRERQPGTHEWEIYKAGIQCKHCNRKIKGCATHAEIAHQQDTVCRGFAARTMEQQMRELVDSSDLLAEGHPGHRWVLQGSKFGCKQCWESIPRRSSKHHLQQLLAKDCATGPVDEAGLNLRLRIHTSHCLVRRGRWVECQQCLRSSRVVDGRLQQWVHQHCVKAKGQQKLHFGPRSSES